MDNLEGFLSKYSLNLTEQQKKAVESVNGATLLLAVPGSGKTTTLVARLGYMIYEKNIDPSNILVLTYTVAATKDMSERFVSIFGDEYKERLEFRTINGICAKIIAYYGRKIGQAPFELESDEKRKNQRISNLYIKIEETYPTESEIRDVSTAFTYIKNMMLSNEEIENYSNKFDIDPCSIYKEYNQEMQKEGLMDYDDQMRYAYNILLRSPETLDYFQNIYKYICVDEAQDTSKIQHTIIALLSKKNDNLFMVGDEDQSIYAFRAAYPDALLEFDKVHKNANILVMEENFRSNAKIVEAADRFIQKNIYRHKKYMKAHRDSGEEIKVKELPTRAAQYTYLEKKLENVTTETAVLYKNNESIIPLIDRLERKNIDYRIKNAELLFFTNRIVMDILDIMHFADDPYNRDLFMQIYYKMNLYLSKQEAETICRVSEKNDISIPTTIQKISFENKYKTDKLNDFIYDLKCIATIKPDNAIKRIINLTGYREYLEKKHIRENKSYILIEIAKFCKDNEEFYDRLTFLQNAIRDNNYYADTNIIFSTIHSSKGLEYDTVYMLDVIDGIIPESIPDKRSTNEDRKIYEEERRMYYVGITRAKNKLILLDTGDDCSFINETVNIFIPSTEPANIFSKNITKPSPADKTDYQNYIKCFKKNKVVIHKAFGEGIIKNTNIPYVTIEFKDKERTFGLIALYNKNLITFPE